MKRHNLWVAPGTQPRLSGLGLVMCAAALWATVGVVTELVPQHSALPRDAYGFMRTLVAAPAILLLAVLGGGVAALRVQPGSTAEFLKFGVYCAVFQLCLFRSFDLLGVTITVFLTVCLPPLIAIGWAALRGTERLPPHVILAFLLGAFGLLAFVSADGAGGDPGDVLPGLALSLGASVAFVLMTQSGRRLAVRHSPLLVSGLGLLAAAGVLLPVALLSAGFDMRLFAVALGSWQGIGAVLYLGLVPTALAYVCYCSGMARCKSATAGLVASMIEPAVAACLAFFLLHEALNSWQVAGCCVMMAAMILLGRGEASGRPQFRTAAPRLHKEYESG